MTHVMACIDGSASSTAVCDYAAWASVRLAAPLTFLHALTEESAPPSDLSGTLGIGIRKRLLHDLAKLDEQRTALAKDHGNYLLEAAKHRVDQLGIVHPQGRQRHGRLVDCIQELESEIRLLVIGRNGHGREAPSEHIGIQVENVILKLKRPVLVTPSQFNIPRSFLLVFDGGETGLKSVETIAQSPFLRGLRCHILMIDQESETAWREVDIARNLLQNENFSVQAAVMPGEVAVVTERYCEEERIDLLVMSSSGHSKIQNFFVGSATSKTLRKATIPMLFLR
ncbi:MULTISPECIES: universal stress protein [Pseudomonas]|uniref:universal stress protein n=1 Tax=Pseudomonas TaxID=286 RepID=UPI0009FBAF4C|nr:MULTISPECIES: universal stress protein [Pseudomonas]MBH4274938.1 universal stress protein [Pseudomonas aeruginosa]NKI48649.1 universal stress protein [Pseudomonas fluorescens]MCU9532654.1 universal stress protein [Pseudomonas mosselii]MCU9540045.1 universal stress protein [Pseudomonas mosselii]MCU9543890.1 universal stress protein [Pseudomonas mosselii]